MDFCCLTFFVLSPFSALIHTHSEIRVYIAAEGNAQANRGAEAWTSLFTLYLCREEKYKTVTLCHISFWIILINKLESFTVLDLAISVLLTTTTYSRVPPIVPPVT